MLEIKDNYIVKNEMSTIYVTHFIFWILKYIKVKKSQKSVRKPKFLVVIIGKISLIGFNECSEVGLQMLLKVACIKTKMYGK